MARFDLAIYTVLCHEGDKVYKNKKTGEISKYGITLKFLRAEVDPGATEKDIDELTEARATMLYHEYWWKKYRFGLIEDQTVATKVFDLAVNTGPSPAIKALQRAINDLILQSEIAADGVLGPRTAEAVNEITRMAFPAGRDALLRKFRDWAELRYRSVVADNPKLAENLNGWLKRLADENIRIRVSAETPA